MAFRPSAAGHKNTFHEKSGRCVPCAAPGRSDKTMSSKPSPFARGTGRGKRRLAASNKLVPGSAPSAQRGFSPRLALRRARPDSLAADHALPTAVSSPAGLRTMPTAAAGGSADQNRYYCILFGPKSQAWERIALGTCSNDFSRRSRGTATGRGGPRFGEVATTSAHNASLGSVGLSQTRDAPPSLGAYRLGDT